ncbi:uncharacterized protein LAESUDRAFT_732499 [Laetiporus sulphureus 93-53]|uniref:DUF6534 domain-containing protein n=1 Tax=Laetiporus sulphureus 93-53 TaxID=1314785 RepID=A0A165B3V4_9APHY|nr:uncharacterized protein LAESUDRAFT_732499 [Laetiporus sulphureus 93-53]KZT00173.1 hypothetical protein LAESUDRAFT_732499 [Laetiporus sulphureus 93-53]
MTGLNLHLGDSMGATLIGVLFSQLFYGCTCAQVLYYMWHYRKDRSSLRSLVAILWSMDTVATIVDIKIVWRYLVAGHANLSGHDVLFGDTSIEYSLAAVMVLIVQCYYMRTIWTLLAERRHNLKLALVVSMVICALVSCVCALVNVYIAIRDPGYPDIFAKAETSAIVQITTASVVDIFISATLTWVLNGGRSGVGYTEKLIRKLTVHVINRGMLTAVIQVMTLVMFVAFPKNAVYWSIFHFPGSKIYVNSLLAVLNARHYYAHGITADITTGLYLPTMQAAEFPLDTIDTVDSHYYESMPSGRRNPRTPGPSTSKLGKVAQC